MKKKRITVNLDPKTHQELAALAEEQDRSLSWVIAQAMKHTIARIHGQGHDAELEGVEVEPAQARAYLAAATKELLAERTNSSTHRRNGLSCLDLFSGAGGLSIGLGRAGFHPELAIDFDYDSCDTYQAAFPGVKVENKPIEGVSFKSFSGIDLVAGGPPCQPFSSGGKRLANADHRNMVPQFLRVVEEARPRAFLMENVPGLFGATHRVYVMDIVQRLTRLGYRVLPPVVLNAAEYGIPQKRRRGFLVGLLNGAEFSLPAKTHGPGTGRGYAPAKSVIDADDIFGEPNSSSVFYAKRPDLRPSPFDGHVFNGGGRPIDLDAPCHTILASAGGNKTHFIDRLGLVPKYHQHLKRGGKPKTGTLEGARRITVEESALIQSFPRKMAFKGSRSSRYSQVGNAVPPRLAEVIGIKLYECLSSPCSTSPCSARSFT